MSTLLTVLSSFWLELPQLVLFTVATLAAAAVVSRFSRRRIRLAVIIAAAALIGFNVLTLVKNWEFKPQAASTLETLINSVPGIPEYSVYSYIYENYYGYSMVEPADPMKFMPFLTPVWLPQAAGIIQVTPHHYSGDLTADEAAALEKRASHVVRAANGYTYLFLNANTSNSAMSAEIWLFMHGTSIYLVPSQDVPATQIDK